MKKYDLTVLMKADTSAEDKDAFAKKIEKTVKAVNGEVTKFAEMGRKQMAYKINNLSEALYLNWMLELPSSSVVELQRKLTVEKNVLRHLLVTVE